MAAAKEDPRAYRESQHLLGVPRALGRSHRLLQSELYREADRPGKPVFNKAVDYLKIMWLRWVWHYVKTRIGGKYPFADYETSPADKGVYVLAPGNGEAGAVRVALVGDWGSGTREADEVGRRIEAAEPHFTIHLGDIYYVGAKKEILENMLGRRVRWPVGSRGSFSLNSNHEMYARGKGYYKYLLPKLGVRSSPDADPQGQKASFFCLESEHWRVIGLDTGYYSVGLPILEKVFKPSCKLHDKLLRWLREDVRIQDDRTRGIVLLSHHQYYSQFDSLHERAARQLSELIGRPVLWFWGHEHRLAIYGKHATRKGRLEAYGRCLGHGGLPIEDVDEPPKRDGTHQVGLVLYDRRVRTSIGRDRTAVGFNGYAVLSFDGKDLIVEYRDGEGDRLLVRERWQVGAGGNLRGVSIERLFDDDDLRLHTASLDDALR